MTDNIKRIINDDKIFHFDKNIYQVFKAEYNFGEIEECCKYAIEVPMEIKENAKVKMMVAFLDEKGNDIAKLYTEDNKEFITVKGTVGIRLEVYPFSYSTGSVEIKNPVIFYLGKVSERRVVIASTAIAYNKGKRTLERNLNETLASIDNAAKENPDIIVASECFYGRNVWNLPFSEKILRLDGEVINKFREKAKKYNTYICFSLHIYLENGNPANLGIIIGRNGETVGTYAKTHITMSELEKGIEPGDEIKVFDLDFGRVGIAICWDLFYPEMARTLHLKGCEIILNPTAGFDEKRTLERAKESGAYIIVSGTQRLSDSIISDPEGNVIARREKGKDYISCEVDLNKDYYVGWLSTPSSSTRKNVFKYERRPDLY